MIKIIIGCQKCAKETTDLERINGFNYCKDCAPIIKNDHLPKEGQKGFQLVSSPAGDDTKGQ